MLQTYNLPEDLSFTIDIPAGVHDILHQDIVIGALGITLGATKLYKRNEAWENQSVIEDSENHFHVAQFIEPENSRLAFMLGVKTLLLLADKFVKQNVTGVRLWYSFESPELGMQFAQAHGFHNDGDKYYISDRLSFYTRRIGEDVIVLNPDAVTFEAKLVIDI